MENNVYMYVFFLFIYVSLFQTFFVPYQEVWIFIASMRIDEEGEYEY